MTWDPGLGNSSGYSEKKGSLCIFPGFLPPSLAPTPTPGVAVYFFPFPLPLPKPHVEQLTFPCSVGSFTRREQNCVAFNNKKETIKAQLAENMDI